MGYEGGSGQTEVVTEARPVQAPMPMKASTALPLAGTAPRTKTLTCSPTFSPVASTRSGNVIVVSVFGRSNPVTALPLPPPILNGQRPEKLNGVINDNLWQRWP